jgi:hypothetical protein
VDSAAASRMKFSNNEQVHCASGKMRVWSVPSSADARAGKAFNMHRIRLSSGAPPWAPLKRFLGGAWSCFAFHLRGGGANLMSPPHTLVRVSAVRAATIHTQAQGDVALWASAPHVAVRTCMSVVCRLKQ